MDGCEDTHRVTTVNIASNVVAAIDIVNPPSKHTYSGSKAGRYLVGIGVQLDFAIGHILAIPLWTDISHTTTAIGINNHHHIIVLRLGIGVGGIDFKKQALWAGHIALISTTIEVADLSTFKEPEGTDFHLRKVVAAKDTRIVAATLKVSLRGIDTHFVQEFIGQQIISCSILDIIHHLALVVDADGGI